ncbi:hypothetical protein [Streptomyces sp. NPDC003077]|uniref:hypothetical protein n=1 Tax=Streptomyces sp. NPDC003077 TaxID=3154443 RepID=UPI0033BCC705
MEQPKPEEPRPEAMGRPAKEPESHTEDTRAKRGRVVPGTASALEGYQAESGTAHGDALEGLEISPEENRERKQVHRRHVRPSRKPGDEKG